MAKKIQKKRLGIYLETHARHNLFELWDSKLREADDEMGLSMCVCVLLPFWKQQCIIILFINVSGMLT